MSLIGLGKTLQSITLLYTCIRQGFTVDKPIARRVLIVCPTSLVHNWKNEIKKWLDDRIECIALGDTNKEGIISGMDKFLAPFCRANVLIVSYDTFRRYYQKFTKPGACDLLICDEAHRLKNHKTATYTSLDALPCTRRVLLSGTPMQNDLTEFFAMVNFVNREVLGDQKWFRKYYEIPILNGREPDALEEERNLGMDRSTELSAIVNQFVLRRTNTLLSQHLPPKVLQVVCCRPTALQRSIYTKFLKSKQVKNMMKDTEGATHSVVLPLIGAMKKLCNHPALLLQSNDKDEAEYDDEGNLVKKGKSNSVTLKDLLGKQQAEVFPKEFKSQQYAPQWSGKVLVLDRLLRHIKANSDDRVVIVCNFTSMIDVFEELAKARGWRYVRLDGSTPIKKRQHLVDELLDKRNGLFLFFLSSKAGGCGLNLVGANRLVLFDPDWNPAVDKQAAARVWRDGQTKRCFIYRFLTSGTIEEKIYQRQLSKEGLQSVIGSSSADSAFSMDDLRDLFSVKSDAQQLSVNSDTHESLDCDCISDDWSMRKLMKRINKKKKYFAKLEEQEDANFDPEDEEGDSAMKGNTDDGMDIMDDDESDSDENEEKKKPQHVRRPEHARIGQRGQPPEEELINWAHHTNVQSVPDPFFRAISKDLIMPADQLLSDDATADQQTATAPSWVSFVFSCEVSGKPLSAEQEQLAKSVSAIIDMPADPVAKPKAQTMSAADARDRATNALKEHERKRKKRLGLGDDEEGEGSSGVQRRKSARNARPLNDEEMDPETAACIAALVAEDGMEIQRPKRSKKTAAAAVSDDLDVVEDEDAMNIELPEESTAVQEEKKQTNANASKSKSSPSKQSTTTPSAKPRTSPRKAPKAEVIEIDEEEEEDAHASSEEEEAEDGAGDDDEEEEDAEEEDVGNAPSDDDDFVTEKGKGKGRK